jgi:hypothetical protein
MNMDGLNDIIVTNAGSGAGIFYQRNDRTFPKQPDFIFNTSGSMHFSDLNNDGLNDFILNEQGGFSVFYMEKNKTYQKNENYQRSLEYKETGNFHYTKSALGDINYDGLIDVIVATSIGNVFAFYQTATNLIPMEYLKLFEVPYKLVEVKIVDINHDMRDDVLVMTNHDLLDGGDIRIYYQSEDGTYSEDPDLVIVPDDYYYLTRMYFGDLNNDALTDIIVLSENGGLGSIHYQLQNNSFNKYHDYKFSATSGDFQIGDITGDGLTDVLLNDKTDDYYRYSGLIQTLDGELKYQTDILSLKRLGGPSYVDIVIRDVDRSGTDDVIFCRDSNGDEGYYFDILVYYQEGTDSDNDGYQDGSDDFPNNPLEWFDTDSDSVGNNEDTDDDGDGIPDVEEDESDPINKNTDYDGYDDPVDEFPADSDEWSDHDNDGIGDNSDTDNDNDGYPDHMEKNEGTDPYDHDSTPDDYDNDFSPDSTDNDIDGDGVINYYDDFPYNESEWEDNDMDGIGDNEDPDDDNDKINDTYEEMLGTDPKSSYSKPDDLDYDGIPDDLDPDMDGDGVDNEKDTYPKDSYRWKKEEDGDGIPGFETNIIVSAFLLIYIIQFFNKKRHPN